MNSPKMMIAALLISGMAMNAKETLQVKKSDSESSSSSLIFKKKYEPRNILKLNNSASSARDWDEAEVNGGGFFVNLGIHFPFSSFLAKDYAPTDPRYRPGSGISDARYKMGFDFEFGNYFRFAKINDGMIGVGLRATWLSVSYAKMTNGSDVYRAAQICPVKLGPQIGVAINDKMGVDAFYQLGFNLTEEFASINDPTNPTGEKIGQSETYLGISHELGAAFHYKVYSVGLGIRFGKLKNQFNYYDGESMDDKYLDAEKKSISNFRITLGFKF